MAIRKSKLALKVSKLAYTGMRTLELSEVFMYKFHYGYLKINIIANLNYYSQTLIV